MIGMKSSDELSMSISLVKNAIGIIDNHITIITTLFDITLAINSFNPYFFLINGRRLKLYVKRVEMLDSARGNRKSVVSTKIAIFNSLSAFQKACK